MSYRLTYEQILAMLRKVALQVPFARAVVRRSGFRPGTGENLPPGGILNDLLKKLSDEDFDYDWRAMGLGAWGEVPMPVHMIPLRNPEGVDATTSTVADWSAPGWLRWSDIPSGSWYYPFNAEWFVTRQDLARADQMELVATNFEAADATLWIMYSEDLSSWSGICSVDLSSTGPLRSEWVDLSEGHRQDVYLAFWIVANSDIDSTHTANVQARVRFFPRPFFDGVLGTR